MKTTVTKREPRYIQKSVPHRPTVIPTRTSGFLSFTYSHREISQSGGKTRIRSREYRFENGELQSEEFDGTLDGSVYFDAVDQAHRTNRRVAAHSITPTGHAIALAAGVDSIEHGQVIDDATAKQMAQKKVFLSPTLTVIGYVDAPRSKTNPIWNAIAKASEESFRRALAAGVQIALGTDAVNKNSCDINDSINGTPGPNGVYRLCWHTSSTAVSSGWRCGQNTSISSGYDRLIFEAP